MEDGPLVRTDLQGPSVCITLTYLDKAMLRVRYSCVYWCGNEQLLHVKVLKHLVNNVPNSSCIYIYVCMCIIICLLIGICLLRLDFVMFLAAEEGTGVMFICV